MAAVTALALAAGTFGTTYAAGDGGAAAGDATSAQASNGAAQTGQTAKAADIQAGCDAVDDWGKLNDCVENKGSSVKLTGLITADGDGATAEDTIIVKGDIAVSAADGAGITGGTKNADGTAVQRKASVFSVSDGATLTIDGGTYKDLTHQNNGAVVLVNENGNLVINGGVFSGNSARNGGVVFAETGSSVTVKDGTFTGNAATATGITDDTATKGGGVVYAKSNVVISGGTFTENFVPEAGGVVQLEKGKLTISGGEFTGNRSSGRMGGGIAYQQSGTTVISGGMFTGNKTTYIGSNAQGGSVVNLSTGSLTVSGGTFEDNSADSGRGGVFYQRDGSTWITDTPMFSGNSAVALNEKGEQQPNKGYAGGGVLYSNYGSVEITGGTFTGNHANASAYMSGGGVIYATGKLTIANADDGTKPTFIRNWASVDAKYPMNEDATTGTLTGKIGQGGAGGAIFLQKNSESYGYFLGGEFEGNISGYLGGAIYTEEGTVSYVGPAAATLNTAGHFGGGLWFCPSGVSDASKSGNIALNGNTVNSAIDSNEVNKTSDDEPTEAGSDLAIMNPYHKAVQSNSNVHDNAFQLLDTWFTDRGTKVVDWYWDGQPRTTASGYADGYMYSDVQGKDAVRAYKYNGSDQYDDVSGGPQKQQDSKYRRAGDDSRQETDTTLQQYWGKAGHDNTYGGIGLKAVLNAAGQRVWQSAWNSAKVTFQHNGARLSGGAFGSNGRVILSTPYSAAWDKVDAADHTKLVAGTTWRVSAQTVVPKDGKYDYTDAAPTNSDRLGYDATCPAMDKRDETNKAHNGCWMHRTGDEDGWVSIIVGDNDNRDNNPVGGEFSIDNLKPDTTYTLKEESAPADYQVSSTVYKFTTSFKQTAAPEIKVQSGSDTPVNNDNADVPRGIVNARLPGLHWTKVGADALSVPLGNSTWKIAGTTSTGQSVTIDNIEDCEVDAGSGCSGLDKDPAKGKFSVERIQPGRYTLTELTAPAGYWVTRDTYTFTVTGAVNETIKLTKNGNEMDTNVVEDTPIGVSWTKVDSSSKASLAGSEWKITWQDGIGGSSEAPNPSTWTVQDCGAEGASCDVDSDSNVGEFAVLRLPPGFYHLTEMKAPDGYVRTDTVYAFTIGKTEGDVSLCIVASDSSKGCDKNAEYVDGNAIPNAKAVSVLPFTGGTGLGRLLMGGGFAAAAALAAAVTYEWRRRRALDM